MHEGGALGGAALAPEQNDQTLMRLAPRQRHKVVAITGDQDKGLRGGLGQDLSIRRCVGQHFAQQHDRVAKIPRHGPEVIEHIVIEEKLHGPPGASYCATSRSISPQWSS